MTITIAVPLVFSFRSAAIRPPTTTSGEVGRASILTVAIVALQALTPMPGVAQQLVVIGDSMACPACTIETGPPVTLAPPTHHVYFSSLPPPIVARDRGGHYIVTRVKGDAVVVAFGADGGYSSSYGRYGEGPSEFASVPMAIAVGESDVVYVTDLRFLHTLAPRGERRLGSKVRLSVPANAAVVLQSGIAVQAPLRTEGGIMTVQIVQPDGTIRASIGVAETNDARSQPGPIWNNTDLRRVLGRSTDQTDVWIAPFDRYRVIRYGPDGEEKTRVERISEWFRARSGAPGTPFSAPADPGLGGIHQDADGLLWIALSRAPVSFSPVADERPPGVEAPAVDPFFDMNRVLHSTVEVLDPVTGELVARREFDEFVWFVNSPGDDVFIYSLHPDVLGNLNCVIRPLKLRRP